MLAWCCISIVSVAATTCSFTEVWGFFFWPPPMACGSSQAGDQIQATAATQATAVTVLAP